MDNKMMKVAKLLGVELEEEFEIMGAPVGCVYKLSEKGVALYHKEENWWEMLPHMLTLLLTGECKIVKLPWKPKMNEEYYVPYIHYAESSMCSVFPWHGDKVDNKLYQLGLVCKTREEAIAMTKKMIAGLEKKTIAVAKEGKNNG